MVDDHEMRAECAAGFAELKGMCLALSNGRDLATKQIDALILTIDKLRESHKRDHEEAVRLFAGYQSSVVDITHRLSERVQAVENSNRALHKRLDGLCRVLNGLTVSLVLLVIGIVVERLLG